MSCNVGIENVRQHRPGLCPTPSVPSTSLSIWPSHVSQHRSWTRPTTSVLNISYPKGPEYIPGHMTGKHLKSGALHTVVNMHSRHGQHLYVLHHGRRTPSVPCTSLSIWPSHVLQHRSWTRPTTSVLNISYPKGPEYIPGHVTGKHLKSGALHTVVNMHSRHGQHLYVLHHGRRIRPTT